MKKPIIALFSEGGGQLKRKNHSTSEFAENYLRRKEAKRQRRIAINSEELRKKLNDNSLASMHLSVYASKIAFTLAEVLITLGIIGVVAALTLPTLIQNYQKQEYVTALKKSYTVISQALKVAMAKDGVDNLDGTTLFQSINGEDTSGTGQEKFTDELKKVFSILETEEAAEVKYKYLSGANTSTEERKYYKAVLNDGTIMYLHLLKEAEKSEFDQNIIRQAGGKMFKSSGLITVDINGDKKPNQWGRDVFHFHIGGDGQVFGANGLSSAIYSTGSKDEGIYYWGNNNMAQCNPEKKSFAGYGCSGRIMEENWEMNY